MLARPPLVACLRLAAAGGPLAPLGPLVACRRGRSVLEFCLGSDCDFLQRNSDDNDTKYPGVFVDMENGSRGFATDRVAGYERYLSTIHSFLK